MKFASLGAFLKISLSALLIISASQTATYGAVVDLLPKPQKLSIEKGVFKLKGDIRIEDPTNCDLLKEFIAESDLKISNNQQAPLLSVEILDSIPGAYDYKLAGYDNEAYHLSIRPKKILIQAVKPIGVIRATQTLKQLALKKKITAKGTKYANYLENVEITDWPAFKLRGYMHDIGRSYIPIDELIRQLRDFSQFKVNTFHWHLTENQAWRFESKRYPQLTSAKSMTREAGNFYTQEDCRRLMEAAKKYGVTVIPEIDMPGHSAAFERAMGFEMQTPQGKEVLKSILEEVAEVFKESPYIHIGADEKVISDKDFLPTIVDKVHSLGKMAVCWNPIHGVKITPDQGFDMTQMWGTAGRAVTGIPNIDCRYNYSNHFDTFADIVGIFKSSIYYADKGNPNIAGAITAPWNDRRLPTVNDITRQNNIYAATLATAERAWRGGGKQYIEQGGTTLPLNGEEYEEFADWERRFLFHKEMTLNPNLIPYVKQSHVLWDITKPSNKDSLTAAEHIRARGAGIYLRHTWGDIVPGLYGKGNTPNTGVAALARTYVYSPCDQQTGALIEFQNYSRSEIDLPPNQGEWDRKGSRILINGKEVQPPVWTNTMTKITNETLLGNENASARPPIRVDLKKGWNEVLVYLPYEKASGVRLNKWLFSFVLTDPEGRFALPLTYSPDKKR